MCKLIAYIRVSTQEQAQSGLGLDAQIQSITNHIGPPDAIIQDAGYGGETLDRPGVAELLATVRRGDRVAVARLDRLSRGDAFAVAWLEHELVDKRGAFIVSAIGEGTGDDSPQGRLFKDMIRAFARFELAMIRQRTSGAVKVKMARKREAGEKTGGRYAPFGFTVAIDPTDGVKRLVADPREQVALSTIRKMRTAQGKSLREIGDWLTEAGFVTRGGGAWSPKVVRGILLRAERG